MFILIRLLIKIYIICIPCIFSVSVFANDKLEDRLIDVLNLNNDINPNVKIDFTKKNQKNVDELGFVLYDLIRKRDFNKVNKIIDEYISHEEHDKNLVIYILSEKAIANQEYDTAITLYNEMLLEQPNLLMIELKLAVAFIYIKRYEDALLVYQTLINKYEKKLPLNLNRFINNQIRILKNKNSWQGMLRIGSSYDFNLNEASNNRDLYCFRKRCMGSGSKSIAGGQWHYAIELSKRYPLSGNHTAQLLFDVVGLEPMKAVSTRKKSASFKGGYQFEKTNKKIRLLPVIEAKWRDNQYNNLSLGVKFAAEYELTNKITLFSDLEVKSKSYIDEYHFNDGNKLTYSFMSTYLVNPRLVVFGGIHGVNRNKKFQSDSYQQYGSKIGMLTMVGSYELLVVTGYKYTKFKQFDDYINTKRKDHNWYLNTQATVGSNKILSFTPSVYFNSQINKSTANIIYAFKQSEVGVNFTKKF